MSGYKENNVIDHGVVEKTRQQVKPPSMYKVILHNDDYTPMDFVIDVLTRFFNMQYEKASEIMLKVHNEGMAVCGVFTAEVAETKVQQVSIYAKEHEHPLLCTMERA
ncbi:MAG: ATP-dependent Clp protease adapter ClpS [Pararheinheimera sp.]|jgi:ATP-dependent Clp protease adaptor protein ClpS|uniref:ATP-dependent Clp protease adapter ClpS n=1 Tax=Rheinheimera sp. KL1 TaxID=1635005 RepID=UPI0006A9CFB0|nr:ATP-dependent Clp protease adapter ClpS [Rheinheimera sp. KL1]KOO57851.1 Clp protease ClpS [Rheinheimera sp. KL1]MBP8227239.1 ATP-dependent Clp protease adapter ClpS [Rheinheimera sp.]